MTKVIIAVILAATLQAGAQEALVPAKDFDWPTSFTAVHVNGIDIPVQWQDGRPKAQKGVLERLMHVHLEGGETQDCIDAFSAHGYRVRHGHIGELDVRNPDSAAASVIGPHASRSTAPVSSPHTTYSAQRPTRGKTGRVTTPAASVTTANRGRPMSEKEASLKSEAIRVTSENGYMRSVTRITNIGERPSSSCIAVGIFKDYFGHTFGVSRMPLKTLGPGESTELTFFSLVEAGTQSDKWECKVNYETVGGTTAAVKSADHPFRSNSTRSDIKFGPSEAPTYKADPGTPGSMHF